MYACTYVCLYVFVYVCMYVCVCVHMCMYVCMYLPTINTEVMLLSQPHTHPDVLQNTDIPVIPACSIAPRPTVKTPISLFLVYALSNESFTSQKTMNPTAPLRRTNNSIHNRISGAISGQKNHLIVFSCKVWRSCRFSTCYGAEHCDRYMFRQYDKQQRAPAVYTLADPTIQSPHFPRTAHHLSPKRDVRTVDQIQLFFSNLINRK